MLKIINNYHHNMTASLIINSPKMGKKLGKRGNENRYNQMTFNQLYRYFAERKGFEPLERESAQRFSRPPHSTTLASLLNLL